MDYSAKLIYKDEKIDIDDDCIYYFYTYRKRDDVKDLPKNDRKREITSMILNFKSGLKNDYKLFKSLISYHLEDFANLKWIVCSIPGHDQVLPIPNHMDQFLKYCNLPSNMLDVPGLLLRNKEMPPKHNRELYGRRTVQKDLDSFKLRKNIDLKGKNIVIFDDITTSGCSLMAAKECFLNAGANRVVCIAFGKTVDVYDGNIDIPF